jgi:predicted DNA-binding protein
MASPLTLRLDEKTRQRIARIARRKQLSTSEVVRQAIEAWVDRQEPVATPFEVMKDLIGVVHGGNPKRSEQTGRQFTALLKRRRSRK